jgi:hypothetical protein
MGIKAGLLRPLRDESYLHVDYYGYGYDYDGTGSGESVYQWEQILVTDWVNWFEFPNNMALEWDLRVGWRAEMGTDFTLLRFFNNSDYSPYAGLGAGLNYVFPNDTDQKTGQRNAGFSLTGRGGIMLFRTYDFRVILDGGYRVTLNSDYDQGAYANIGILWRKSSSRYRAAQVGTGTRVLAGIGGTVVVLILIGIVSSATY